MSAGAYRAQANACSARRLLLLALLQSSASLHTLLHTLLLTRFSLHSSACACQASITRKSHCRLLRPNAAQNLVVLWVVRGQLQLEHLRRIRVSSSRDHVGFKRDRARCSCNSVRCSRARVRSSRNSVRFSRARVRFSRARGVERRFLCSRSTSDGSIERSGLVRRQELRRVRVNVRPFACACVRVRVSAVARARACLRGRACVCTYVRVRVCVGYTCVCARGRLRCLEKFRQHVVASRTHDESRRLVFRCRLQIDDHELRKHSIAPTRRCYLETMC
eukprot:5386197-Pleurochrysis_carterae.AAC.1